MHQDLAGLREEDMEEDGLVLVSKDNEAPIQLPQGAQDDALSDIDDIIDHYRAPLWGVNKFIHENPELAFKEYKAHQCLTDFMQLQKNWEVKRSVYGMETAWVAVFDSGREGPVVSFNAEMGS